jgi:hypothetical protein
VAEHGVAAGGLTRLGGDGNVVDPKTRERLGMVTAQVDSASPYDGASEVGSNPNLAISSEKR